MMYARSGSTELGLKPTTTPTPWRRSRLFAMYLSQMSPRRSWKAIRGIGIRITGTRLLPQSAANGWLMERGVVPPSTTRRMDCGRVRPSDRTIQMLRSPGRPSQRTSSQNVVTPPRAMGAETETPPQARAMLSGTLASGRWVTIMPRLPLPWFSASARRSNPGPVAPSPNSPCERKEVSDDSKRLATLSRYSTANAGALTTSTATTPAATAASLRPNVIIEPPGSEMSVAPRSMPSGGPTGVRIRRARGFDVLRRLAVQVLARRGRRPALLVPLLPQQELVEPDRTAREGHRRAGQVEEPRPVRPLARDGAGLVGARLQALHPLAAGARVVQAEVLDVEDLPARALHLRHGLGHAGEIAVGEHVVVEEVGLARPLPVELVVDAVVEVQPPVVEHRVHAAEEGRVVRDAHVLDDPDGCDLVVAGIRRQVAEVAVLDAAAPLEALPLDARGGPLGLRARQRHAVRGHAVVLGRPDAEPAPPAADVEERLA